MAKIFVGDIGTKVRLDAGIDISEATKIEIHYKKPSGSTGVWAANLESTNFAYYLTTTDDLDENGIWEVQLYVEQNDWKGHGDIASFQVFESL